MRGTSPSGSSSLLILRPPYLCRADNGKSYIPNNVLSQKQITNMGRSPDMGEAIDFYVDVTTPGEKIAALKERMGEYIKALPHHWWVKLPNLH